MADNVAITPGSGDTVAADDIGGAKYQRVKVVIGADGTNDGDISSANPLPTSLVGTVSTANSSAVALGGGAAFTGTGEDVKNYNWIQVNVFADQASATNGLSLQYSSDNTNWDSNDTYTIAASTGKLFSVQAGARYFRIVYTNGATPQGVFRLQTLYKYSASKPSSQRASDGYTNETDLEQNQAFNMLLNPSGTWDRQRSDSGVATGATRVVHATDVATSMNIVSGTLPTVTRVSNVVDGTLTTVTTVGRVNNVVDGTLSTVTRVSNVIDGTLSTVTTVGRVNNIVAGTVTITGTNSSLAVFLDPGHLLGSVTANAGTGTFTVAFDPGHELGTIKGNSNTLTVFLPDTGHEIGTIRGNTNTLTVFLPDTGHTIGKVDAGSGTFTFKTDPGYELGSIRGISNSINAYIGATAGTLNVQLKPGAVLVDSGHTSQIFTVSGTTSTAGNNTLVSPSASYNFKVFAYSIQSTGIVSFAPRFTTGASAGATELWRPLINAAQTTSTPVGANLAVAPPGYIFATGTNVTLALYLDTGSLIHYSVSYSKESA